MSCCHGYTSTPSRLMIKYQDLFYQTDRARGVLRINKHTIMI
jgi:hypothetical protein